MGTIELIDTLVTYEGMRVLVEVTDPTKPREDNGMQEVFAGIAEESMALGGSIEYVEERAPCPDSARRAHRWPTLKEVLSDKPLRREDK